MVLHNGDADKQHVTARNEGQKHNVSDDSRTASSSSQDEIARAKGKKMPTQDLPTFHRDITFADEIKGPNRDASPPSRVPQQLSPEEHIAFLERQRNPNDKDKLRIPGPRDFDNGREPEPLSIDDDGGEATLQASQPGNDSSLRKNITIDEPGRLRLRMDTNHIPRLSTRRSANVEDLDLTEEPPHSARLRNRTGTLNSLRHWTTRENEPPTPYLTWQPTIGRNSAFVDLTEEQREELGGIEYRSLKTLAVVLICRLGSNP